MVVKNKPVALKKKKPAPVGDVTRTARAKTHLGRLEEAKGKRLVVDLAAPARNALEQLVAFGYEANQKEVVTKALLEAQSRLKNG